MTAIYSFRSRSRQFAEYDGHNCRVVTIRGKIA